MPEVYTGTGIAAKMFDMLSDFKALSDAHEPILAFLRDPGRTNLARIVASLERLYRNHVTSFPAVDLLKIMEDYEKGAGQLVGNHRLHYFHVFYVWLLGLCLYRRNDVVRQAIDASIKRNYPLETRTGRLAGEDEEVWLFLYEWTLTALFHDIAYPFELSFEAIQSFLARVARIPGDPDQPKERKAFVKSTSPIVLRPGGFEQLVRLPLLAGASEIERRAGFHSALDLVADNLGKSLFHGNSLLGRVAVDGYFDHNAAHGIVDHGSFGAAIVLSQIHAFYEKHEVLPDTFYRSAVNSAAAIFLHNAYPFHLKFHPRNPGRVIATSGDKEKARRIERLRISDHALGWLLILCDNLQEWAKYESESSHKISDEDVEMELNRYDLQITRDSVLLRIPPSKMRWGKLDEEFPRKLTLDIVEALDTERLDDVTPLGLSIRIEDNRPGFAAWILDSLGRYEKEFTSLERGKLSGIKALLSDTAGTHREFIEKYLASIEELSDSPHPNLRFVAARLIGKLEFYANDVQTRADRIIDLLSRLVKDPWSDVWVAAVLSAERLAFVPEIREKLDDAETGFAAEFSGQDGMKGWQRRRGVGLAHRVRRLVRVDDPIVLQTERFLRDPKSDVFTLRSIIQAFPWVFSHQAGQIDLKHWCKLIRERANRKGDGILATELLRALKRIVLYHRENGPPLARRVERNIRRCASGRETLSDERGGDVGSLDARAALHDAINGLIEEGVALLESPPPEFGKLLEKPSSRSARAASEAASADLNARPCTGVPPVDQPLQAMAFGQSAGEFIGALLAAANPGRCRPVDGTSEAAAMASIGSPKAGGTVNEGVQPFGLDLALLRRVLASVERSSGLAHVLPWLPEALEHARHLASNKSGKGARSALEAMEKLILEWLDPVRLRSLPSSTSRKMVELASEMVSREGEPYPAIYEASLDCLGQAMAMAESTDAGNATVAVEAGFRIIDLPEERRLLVTGRYLDVRGVGVDGREKAALPMADPLAALDRVLAQRQAAVALLQTCREGASASHGVDRSATGDAAPAPSPVDRESVRAGVVLLSQDLQYLVSRCQERPESPETADQEALIRSMVERAARAADGEACHLDGAVVTEILLRFAELDPERAFERLMDLLARSPLTLEGWAAKDLFKAVDRAIVRWTRRMPPADRLRTQRNLFAKLSQLTAVEKNRAAALAKIRRGFAEISGCGSLRLWAASLMAFEKNPADFMLRPDAARWLGEFIREDAYARGMVENVAPWLTALDGLAQGSYHDLDALTHTLEVAANVDRVLDRFDQYFPRIQRFQAAGALHTLAWPADPRERMQHHFGLDRGPLSNVPISPEERSFGERRRAHLRLAAYLHDIGKADVSRTRRPDEEIHFHGHEQRSAIMAAGILGIVRSLAAGTEGGWRIELPEGDARRIQALVYWHQSVMSLFNEARRKWESSEAPDIESGSALVDDSLRRWFAPRVLRQPSHGSSSKLPEHPETSALPCPIDADDGGNLTILLHRDDLPDLLVLFLADLMASRQGGTPDALSPAIRLVNLCLARVEELERLDSVAPPLLSGRDVMRVLGIRPGPHMSVILDALNRWASEAGCTTNEAAVARLEGKAESRNTETDQAHNGSGPEKHE